MITLVGTGHVFDIGARVRDEIRKRAPTIVAIELDAARYQGLRTKPSERDRARTPYVYRMLADFQKRIAESYGVEAGAEMLAAADEAQSLAVPLALIDADAQRTFQRLLREMGFWEKTKLAGSALGGLFLPGKSVEKQVNEMQEDYTSYFEEMGKRFPTLKRVLLDERNVHMANALAQINDAHPRIVAVVGDGHVDGMAALLRTKGLEVETVRLKELRGPPAPPPGNASATLTMDVPGVPPPPRS